MPNAKPNTKQANQSADPAHAHRITPGSKVSLSAIDPAGTPCLDAEKNPKKTGEERLEKDSRAIADLQEKLWAENNNALLVILQGMDTSGKDGVIRHVFSGVNPQGCKVTSFKKPSEAEADRDYLWRIHAAVPAKGEIGVYNRAHYEDVLVVRVHNFVPESVWKQRYAQINACEEYLTQNHVTILKFMLHISKDEQRERLQARLDDPAKRWKFSPQDIEERKFWPRYMEAYEAALSRCSTQVAPWYVIPADRKWYARYAIARIVRSTLEAMNPKPPKVTWDAKAVRIT